MDLECLPGARLVNVLMNFFVEDSVVEKEVGEARDNARAMLIREMDEQKIGYDNYEKYGRSNDNFGSNSEEPLPYIPPTDQTEDGYVGLMPPLA